ncbi:hypothetical protein D7D81_06055 [Halocella sp. SP3-1]|nr:hypothetical protein D7D81_06055 [Halocella sp. SP3-1]
MLITCGNKKIEENYKTSMIFVSLVIYSFRGSVINLAPSGIQCFYRGFLYLEDGHQDRKTTLNKISRSELWQVDYEREGFIPLK